MKKQSVAIIGVIAFVLAVAVGYALFSDTITINGTATAKGDFDVNIIAASAARSGGVNEDTLEADYTTVDDALSIHVDLLYPGAYAEFDVTTKNEGSIPAVLKSITATGLPAADSPIKVTYPNLTDLENSTLAADGTQSFTIRIEWDENDETNPQDASADFDIVLNYEQITVTQ